MNEIRVIEVDSDQEEWEHDEQARRESFNRKMDQFDLKDSIVDRGGDWIQAGQLSA